MTRLFTRMTLIDKLKSSNSEAAWTEFVSYYKGYIYALLHRMNIPSSDCDDLLQLILVKCWKHLPDFEYNPERCKFRSWLTVVVRNTIRDYLKSKGRKNKELEVDIDLLNDSLESNNNDSIESIYEKEWRIYVAEIAWKKVCEDFKSTVTDVFIRRANGEKIASIGADMNLSQSTISTYEKRVRRAISKEIIRLETFLS